MEAEAQHAAPAETLPGHLGLAEFPCTPQSVGDARRWVRDLLGWLSEDDLDNVTVIVSELVTNAVTHTNSAKVSVAVTYIDAVLRVEVTDDGSGEWGIPQVGRDGGRGLAIVEELSDRYAVKRSGDTTVWVEMKTAG